MKAAAQEVEIKFKVEDIRALMALLGRLGFRVVTERAHEENMLYDLPELPLRRRGAILRIRHYGDKWTVTYKDEKGSSGQPSAHKTRREIETETADGRQLASILEALGFQAVFAYEKFRSEWTDGFGHIVVDETPVGDFAEIEGDPAWIDRTAASLGISRDQYITLSYAEVFANWKKKNRSRAAHMTFAECK